MKKKWIATVIAACLALSAFAGCGDKNGGSNESISNNESDGKKQENNSDAPGNAGSAEGFEFTGYPVDTEMSLNMWASQLVPSSLVSGWKESPFHTGLAEMTGIQMDWTFPTAGTDANQAFNLMLADKTLPDLIWHGLINDAESYIKDGVLRDLTDLLPKYAPNYWKFLQENPYYDKAMKTDSGQYYGFGFYREDMWQAVYMGPMVRKDWLDEQSLPVPETIADWETTIRRFNEAYGAKFAFCTNWRMSPGPAGAFGAYGGFETAIFVDGDGKVQVAQARDEWKDYMTWLHNLNEEGLIDPDVVTLDDAGLKTKVANNQVGITNTSMATMTGYIDDAKINGNGAQWVGCPYPVMEKGGKTACIFSEDSMVGSVVCVTTSCPEEKLELALRWLDYAFTEEGNMYWNFGKEGDTYTMVDGVPTFTEKITNSEYTLGDALGLYTGVGGYGLGVQRLEFVRQKNAPESVAAVDIWYGGNEEATRHIYPTAVTMTPEETTESSTIRNALNTYVKEMALKFLTGEESLDQFDSFINTLNDMGLERMIAIYQAAYDRFQNR